MVSIQITKKNNNIDKITLKGHAGYAAYGKDIVCAGVSAILTTSVNAILSFDKAAVKILSEEPFELQILSHDAITSKLLLNMISLFKEMAESYPKNITVKEDENNV